MAEQSEAVIREAVLHVLESEEFADELRRRRHDKRDDDAAEGDLLAAEARLVELAEMFGVGEIDRASFLVARKRAEVVRDEARSKVSAARHSNALDPTEVIGLRDRWPSLSDDRRRAIITAVIDRIEVAPAVQRRQFDQDRLKITWRA